MILSVVQIALLIMLPLVYFYFGSGLKPQKYILHIIILYFIWYLTYALFHELCHMVGVCLMNKTIYDYQLIPHFWKGDFNTGFIEYNFSSDKKDFFIVILPYVRDIALLYIGYILLKKINTEKPFVIGLILILCIFSPLFDIVNNYSAFLFGSLNDFNSLRASSNGFVSNFIGISFSLISFIFAIIILRNYKSSPSNIEI